MEISKRAHRRLATIVISIFSASAALLLELTTLLEPIEWKTFDQRMSYYRTTKAINENVAVILIDEAALQDMNPLVGRWPWPRSVHADIIEFLQSGGAAAVVFDLLFTENTNGVTLVGKPNIHDQRLIEATSQSNVTYHAAQLYTEIPDENEQAIEGQSLPQDFLNHFSMKRAALSAVHNDNTYLLPLNGLYQAARGVGIVGLEPDGDGIYRRARLLFTYHDHILPALSIVALPVFADTTSISAKNNTIEFGRLSVPLDEQQAYLINMVGQYHPYSMSGVLSSIKAIRDGDVEKVRVFPDEFKDKVVFIGASAAGLEDIKPTAVSAKTPGVYIHASVASNFLENDFLRISPLVLTLAIVLLLTKANSVGILYSRTLAPKIVIPFAMACGYLALATTAFKYNWVMPVTTPLLAMAISLLSSLTYLAFTEGKDKRRVRNMLSQYVSPAVLAEVVDKYQEQIGAQVGKREHLTILFSDVRGFTSFSEKLAAEQVVEILNIHFGVMTDIIFSKNGTLDKFIGDAIMAFWGAPIRDNQHADLAVQSAIEMIRSMSVVNARLGIHGYPPIQIGIGINTGDVVLGNIGSEKKLDYTVIGDNVNLASRLEGLTSKYHCPILISENTYNELQSEIICGVVDLVKVKGKSIPIKLYWPLAHADDSETIRNNAKRSADLMQQAFSRYLHRQWDEAEALYRQIGLAQFSEIFIDRCQEFRVNPPGSDWDGVFVLTSK